MPATRKRPDFDPRQTLKKLPREAAHLRRAVYAGLTPRQRQKLRATTAKLNKELNKRFVIEEIELVKDCLLTIGREADKTPNELLQRSVWAALDAVALHLDYSGFTQAFREFAPRAFLGVKLDDPDFVAIEWQATLDYLQMSEAEIQQQLGLNKAELAAVMKEAEDNRNSKTCGLSRIGRKEFSFQSAFEKACGRPVGILEGHHSPQSKVWIAIVVGGLNILAVVVWCVPGFVITIIVLLILLCVGC